MWRRLVERLNYKLPDYGIETIYDDGFNLETQFSHRSLNYKLPDYGIETDMGIHKMAASRQVV